MFGTVKQFDGHGPQASSVTANAERKVSRWLEFGVWNTACQAEDGNKHPSQHRAGLHLLNGADDGNP